MRMSLKVEASERKEALKALWNSSNLYRLKRYGSFQKTLGKIDIDFSSWFANSPKKNREVSDQILNLSLSESSDFHLKIDGHDLSTICLLHDLTADFGVLQIRHDTINFDLSASAIFRNGNDSLFSFRLKLIGESILVPVNGFT